MELSFQFPLPAHVLLMVICIALTRVSFTYMPAQCRTNLKALLTKLALVLFASGRLQRGASFWSCVSLINVLGIQYLLSRLLPYKLNFITLASSPSFAYLFWRLLYGFWFLFKLLVHPVYRTQSAFSWQKRRFLYLKHLVSRFINPNIWLIFPVII